jgi:hypothetical protein
MKSKGAEYSTFFRKAGIAWGKGDIQKAMAILEHGIALATSRSDTHVVQILQQDLERYRRLATGNEPGSL